MALCSRWTLLVTQSATNPVAWTSTCILPSWPSMDHFGKLRAPPTRPLQSRLGIVSEVAGQDPPEQWYAMDAAQQQVKKKCFLEC
ncbi:hypothetical protein V5799_004522 [Amblyomma americanum]|uniref:Uncharacterized protein n=1 Tax=Amblyomma americanum TaxID=6943 RepID=A0AAQ4D5V5_AMBAM